MKHVAKALAFLFCLNVYTLNAQAGNPECLDALKPLESYEHTTSRMDEARMSMRSDEDELKRLTEWIEREIKTEIEHIEQEIKFTMREPELYMTENFVEQRQRLIVQRERFILQSKALVDQQRVADQLHNPALMSKQALKKRKKLIDQRIKLISKQIQLVRHPKLLDHLRGGHDWLLKRRTKLVGQRTQLMIQHIIDLIMVKSELIKKEQIELFRQQLALVDQQGEKLVTQKAQPHGPNTDVDVDETLDKENTTDTGSPYVPYVTPSKQETKH